MQQQTLGLNHLRRHWRYSSGHYSYCHESTTEEIHRRHRSFQRLSCLQVSPMARSSRSPRIDTVGIQYVRIGNASLPKQMDQPMNLSILHCDRWILSADSCQDNSGCKQLRCSWRISFEDISKPEHGDDRQSTSRVAFYNDDQRWHDHE